MQPDRRPAQGADAIYNITDPANPRFLSYFKIPRTQTNTENCVAHNGNLIPNKKGRDILVQSWYQGGMSVIDWTKPKRSRSSPGSIAGRSTETRLVLGGFWSSYFYNGCIYCARSSAASTCSTSTSRSRAPTSSSTAR